MLYWLLRSVMWLVRWVPRKPREAVAGFFCVLVYWCWAEKRQHTINNMAHVLGRQPSDRRVRQVARRSWYNYGRCLMDFLNFPNVSGQKMVEHLLDVSPAEGGWAANIKEALARGKGVLVATAHVGSWDVAGVLAATRFPLSGVAETFKDPRMDKLVQGHREEKGYHIIALEGSGPRKILRAFLKNEIVGIPVDRPMTPKDGVPITFFGSKTYVSGGPAALALKAGATILPGVTWYLEQFPGAYYCKVWPPISAEPLPGKTTQEQIIELTQRIYDALEEVIRAYPDQWYMFRPFWPEETPVETPARALAKGVSQ